LTGSWFDSIRALIFGEHQRFVNRNCRVHYFYSGPSYGGTPASPSRTAPPLPLTRWRRSS